MKKSLEQQIAELTPEQKNSMEKIYKKYLLSIFSVVLVSILIIFVLYSKASIKAERAMEKYDRLETAIRLNKYDASLYDEQLEALVEYDEMKQKKSLAFVVGSGVCLLGDLGVYFIFKRKYPYFSEKKYSYLKKAKKLNQNS